MNQVATTSSKKRSTFRRFVDRYRMETFLVSSAALQLVALFFWYTPPNTYDSLDKLIDEVAFVDNLVIQDPNVGEAPDDGEFEVTDTLKKKEDKRIAGAQDALLTGATEPIDLSPNVTPIYTDSARSAGVTGRITLEVIIADTGEVLRARPVGKTLGYGLEEAAVEAFYKKRYAPSKSEGKAITVKVYVPVNFSLY